MGTFSPTPERAEITRGHGPSLGGVAFGVAFLVLSALIFTVVLKHHHTAPVPEASQPPMPQLPLTYPPARTVDASDTHFGVKVTDPYRWLEDGRSPEVQKWVAGEDKLARSYLAALPGRAAFARRYARLLHVDMVYAPWRAADRYFYMKRKADEEKAVLYWKSATDPNAPAHVLIDPNPFIAKDNASLGFISTSLDGKLLAYTLKPNNADETTLYVMDVNTGLNLPGEVIDGAGYRGVSWLPDGSGFIYTFLPPGDPAHPENRPGSTVVRYHKLGTDSKNDPVIHAKTGDPTKFIGAGVSRDGKWLFCYQENGGNRFDLYYQPLNGQPTADLAGKWKPIVVGKDFYYSLQVWKGQAYIITNEDAPHYRVFKVSLDDPSRSKWREIIPQSPTYVLSYFSVVGNCLVLNGFENIASRIEIRDLDGKLMRRLELPDIGTAEAGGNPDYDDLFYYFQNFTQLPEVFKTSVTNDAATLWSKIDMPIDPSSYMVEQKFFLSKDGARIPMFIVHRKDILLNNTTPFVINGYGGFETSMLPGFFPGVSLWLEAGGGFALVNLRGGGEFGEQWHRDGMLLKKQNVFDDCIAAANFLINEGYTSADRLAVWGGSNGGLLVGAVITQRPDLFRAAVCEAPLLDMIRFPEVWMAEYGSPGNEEQFKALFAYSPYHHVKPGTPYPSVLFCTPKNDDRVAPMHAFKMAAALQAATSSTNPILLRVETQSGHDGGDQISKTVQKEADIWSFLIHELGASPSEITSGAEAAH